MEKKLAGFCYNGYEVRWTIEDSILACEVKHEDEKVYGTVLVHHIPQKEDMLYTFYLAGSASAEIAVYIPSELSEMAKRIEPITESTVPFWVDLGVRVRLSDNNRLTGKIIYYDTFSALVEFDQSRAEFHSGNRLPIGTAGQCYYCQLDSLESEPAVHPKHEFEPMDRVKVTGYSAFEGYDEFGAVGEGTVLKVRSDFSVLPGTFCRVLRDDGLVNRFTDQPIWYSVDDLEFIGSAEVCYAEDCTETKFHFYTKEDE